MSTGVIFILGKGGSPILASGVKSTWPQGSSAPGFSRCEEWDCAVSALQISFLHILAGLILCKRHKAGCSVLVFLYKPDLIGANHVKIEKIALMGGYNKLGVSFR